MLNLAGIRKDYSKATLDITTVHPDPVIQFETWFQEVLDAAVLEPSAMALASVNKDGRPSLRIMLLKGIEEGKFIFYSNYKSRKGKELQINSACAATFFWPELERQVRIEGNAELLKRLATEEYFKTRPRDSQVAAWASPQSESIRDRKVLEDLIEQTEGKFKRYKVLPLPPHWGGYALSPLSVEFWQGRPSRLHDRILYTRKQNTWTIERLAP